MEPKLNEFSICFALLWKCRFCENRAPVEARLIFFRFRPLKEKIEHPSESEKKRLRKCSVFKIGFLLILASILDPQMPPKAWAPSTFFRYVSQDPSKTRQDTSTRGPRASQEAPRVSQDGPKASQEGLKTPQNGPKSVPRVLQERHKSAQDAKAKHNRWNVIYFWKNASHFWLKCSEKVIKIWNGEFFKKYVPQGA